MVTEETLLKKQSPDTRKS